MKDHEWSVPLVPYLSLDGFFLAYCAHHMGKKIADTRPQVSASDIMRRSSDLRAEEWRGECITNFGASSQQYF